MKSKKFLINVVILLTGLYSYGQYACDILSHSIKSENNLVLVTQTSAESASPGNLVATKLDTNGATIWRQEYVIPGFNASPRKIYDATGDFYFIIASVYAGFNQSTQLWKIDKNNGNLIWRSTPFYGSIYNVDYQFIDYDANRIVFIEPLTDSGGDDIGFKVHSVNKADSSYAPTLVYQNNQNIDSCNFVKDSKGNLIYSYRVYISNVTVDPYIKKVNGLDFNTTIWEKKYTGLATVPILPSIQNIYIDSSDNIYALSDEAGTDLFKINSNNGSVLWSLKNVTTGGNFISDLKFKEDYLYISFKHRNVGATISSYEIVKINVTNGTLYWQNGNQANFLQMTPVGTPNASNGTQQAMLAFDFDCNGNIFSTGYYASVGYGPEAWGIMKIDGNTGYKIIDKTIYNTNNQIIDYQSVGLSAYVINNEPIFLGNLEYMDNKAVRAFVKTDLSMNNITTIQSPCSVLETNNSIHADTIQLYPNPTKGMLYFELKNDALLDSVSLYSIEGKELNSWYNTNSIDLTIYPIGMYLVKIVTIENEIVIKKIIKN